MEIDRRAILAFVACTLAEARAFTNRPTFHHELPSIRLDGKPL
jgi:hypothetical protein